MDLEGRVKSAIMRALHLQSSPAGSLRMGATPGWDSLGHMTVIMELERDFGIRVPVSKISELTDVASITRAFSAGMK